MPMPLGAVGITSFTQTASGPLKYEVSVALRRASMLSCCFPEVALAKPGSSNTTHEPLAISDKLMATSGLYTDLGTGAHCALIGRDLEVLAIAAQDNGLLRNSRPRRRRPSRPRRRS